MQNFVSVFDDGKLIHRQAKVLLPTYGPFDDARYFEPGRVNEINNLVFRGTKIGFLICEDGWYYSKEPDGRLLYKHNPVMRVKKNRPDFVISISASPFHRFQQVIREDIFRDLSYRLGVPVVYVNQVGSIDGVGFDGASFVVLPNGTIPYKLGSFHVDQMTIEMTGAKSGFVRRSDPNLPAPQLSENDLVLRAVIDGTREYARHIGLRTAVFGLSGGLDSAMTAFFMAQALGPENVFVIKMPSSHSSEGSRTDADLVVRNLGIPAENVFTISIDEIIKGFGSALAQAGIDLGKLSESDSTGPYETLQARSRMVLEYFISTLGGNLEHPFFKTLLHKGPQWQRLLRSPKFKVQTSNKSELATGNGAIFADMAGFLAPNGDLFKTDLWDLAEHINQRFGRELIPVSIIGKEPSAELMNNQFSIDRFPSYKVIDPILKDLVSGQLTQAELKGKYQHLDAMVPPRFRPIVEFVSRLYFLSEYKRQLSQAPIVRVSLTPFGKEFRKPITIKRQSQVPNLLVLACHILF